MSDTQLSPRRSTRPLRSPVNCALVASLLAIATACGSGTGGSPDTIDSEVFIQTFVDLRISALDTDSQRIAPLDREAILSEHSVTADDLTQFATTHGDDLEFMREVWNEVELRMDRMPAR
jgi:hypothetical protein